MTYIEIKAAAEQMIDDLLPFEAPDSQFDEMVDAVMDALRPYVEDEQ